MFAQQLYCKCSFLLIFGEFILPFFMRKIKNSNYIVTLVKLKKSKNMKFSMSVILLSLAMVLSLSCNVKSQEKNSQQENVIQVVEASEYDMLKTGEILIDIRTPEEFESGHLEGAVNINFFDADFMEQLSAFNKEESVFIYCRSGGRSAKASSKMQAAGFTKVIDLKGGIKSWRKNNLKIVK